MIGWIEALLIMGGVYAAVLAACIIGVRCCNDQDRIDEEQPLLEEYRYQQI